MTKIQQTGTKAQMNKGNTEITNCNR